MLPAIVHIRYSLTVRLQNALICRDTTYRIWYAENNVPLADVATEWKATAEDTRFTFLGMAWNPAVLQKECNLTDEAIAVYRTKLNKGTSMQLTAYYLAVGPTLFSNGPHQLLQQLVLQADFKQLNSYLAFARGEIGLLIVILTVLDPNKKLGYVEQQVENIYELRLLVYSTQINV